MIINEKQIIFLLHYLDLHNHQSLTNTECDSLRLRANQLVNEIRAQQPLGLKEVE